MAALRRRVVVTGIGIVSPLGVTAKESWKALLDGKVATRALTPEDGLHKLAEVPSKVAACVDKSRVVPTTKEDKAVWSRTSAFIQYAMLASDDALAHSQYKPSTPEEQDASGVYVGTGIGCLEEIVGTWETLKTGGYRRVSPHFVPKILGNLATGNISLRHGLRGPNHACITACASGAHAIGDSFRMIQYGDADVMVTGGTEACINDLSLAGFGRIRALSTKFNDDPQRASRPFDSARDGFVIGEGSAILVLEELSHALRRNAPILAEVVGYGMSGDSHHITSPPEDGSGAQRSMKAALRNAGMESAGKIGYINAHATSTPVGDAIEGKAIEAVMGPDQVTNLLVSSTKGATGHLLGAAGAIEAAFTVLSLHDQTFPHTANLTDPNPTYAFRLVQKEPVHDPTVEYAMSNSFGFGGVNVSLIFRRWKGE